MYRAYQDIVWSKYDDTRNIASMMWMWGTQKSWSSKRSELEEAVNDFQSVMTAKLWRTFKK
jgi:hypothetical protein